MRKRATHLPAATALAATALAAQASSHREALAVLNEPWADNTDTYAWVKPGSHDKEFLPRFPFLAPAHQGLLQGHGDINTPPVPNIPVP